MSREKEEFLVKNVKKRKKFYKAASMSGGRGENAEKKPPRGGAFSPSPLAIFAEKWYNGG
jgi:hypothetical protein